MTVSRTLPTLVLITLLAGCASLERTFDEMFAKTPPAAGEPGAGGTFYAKVDGLAVHEQPARTAKVVGKLALREKVVRTRLERGWAYVRAEKSGLAGWVDNAQLDWRLAGGAAPADAAHPSDGAGAPAKPEEPAAPAGGAAGESAGEERAAPAEASPAAQESSAPTPTSTPATVDAPTAAKPTAAPASIFDPF